MILHQLHRLTNLNMKIIKNILNNHLDRSNIQIKIRRLYKEDSMGKVICFQDHARLHVLNNLIRG